MKRVPPQKKYFFNVDVQHFTVYNDADIHARMEKDGRQKYCLYKAGKESQIISELNSASIYYV